MSIDPNVMDDGANPCASPLLMRGQADHTLADLRWKSAVDDYLQRPEHRLDDRERAALDVSLGAAIGAVEAELRQYAARLLAGREAPEIATRLISDPAIVRDALMQAGVLRDGALLRELLVRVRQEQLCEALPPAAANAPDRPSLLVRLAGQSDMIIASAASALLAAEARRRNRNDTGAATRGDLPAELHQALVWQTAAALRSHFGQESDPGLQRTLDQALTEAALRSLAAHDEGERLEAAAQRLAAAISAQPGELPGYLLEAIGDGRVSLFIALLAQAMGFGYDLARDLVLDPVTDRLWLVLRALMLDRPAIATIGLALCEADPRRNIDRFADELDTIMTVDPQAARDALATLSLHPDFRRAAMALAHARSGSGRAA